jgi:hypothetical protein
MKPWHESLGALIWWVTRYAWAPFMVIGGPILAIYGAIHPRQLDIEALQLRSAQVPVLVGVSGEARCVGSECTSSGQRIYLIFPHVLLGGEINVVTENSSGVTVEREPFLAYIFLLVWAGGVYLTWRFCIYPLLPASNNQLERSRS